MKKFSLALVVLTVGAATGTGVILFDTGDPNVNTTAPGGTLANSGWQYQGDWGGYLGTPISPKFFISAAHFGQGDIVLNYQNVGYPGHRFLFTARQRLPDLENSRNLSQLRSTLYEAE